MAEPVDPRVRARVAEIERELRESLENQIVGAVEAGVWFMRAQEQAARWAERVNAEPLSVRLRYLAFVTGNEIVEGDVTDVRFGCEPEPLEGDPARFRIVLRADVNLARSIEAVYVTAKVTKLE